MNFLVNKHVYAEPKKTNKKQLEKAMGCRQIQKNPHEYSEIDTCKFKKKIF